MLCIAGEVQDSWWQLHHVASTLTVSGSDGVLENVHKSNMRWRSSFSPLPCACGFWSHQNSTLPLCYQHHATSHASAPKPLLACRHSRHFNQPCRKTSRRQARGSWQSQLEARGAPALPHGAALMACGRRCARALSCVLGSPLSLPRPSGHSWACGRCSSQRAPNAAQTFLHV